MDVFPIPGSAGEGVDLDNIAIIIDNDQLVYDISPGELLEINAEDTGGNTITSVTWFVDNQPIPAADDNVFFTYQFAGAASGDTHVVNIYVVADRYTAE
ncbi:MAG: hypothetical protein KJ804_14755 [Proteobacteria bacterium]|nr:hypothetical protein [Pseudomonadota bacterium]MBU1059569.1 hypothetical protein [Pseudomonadota bacterium]